MEPVQVTTVTFSETTTKTNMVAAHVSAPYTGKVQIAKSQPFALPAKTVFHAKILEHQQEIMETAVVNAEVATQALTVNNF